MKNSRKKKLLIIGCCLAAVFFFAYQTARIERIRKLSEPYMLRIEEEKQFILKNQCPEGAILLYSRETAEEKGIMNPYFACLAARGLLAGTASDRDLQAVERYIDWHVGHLNEEDENAPGGSGSIYDYQMQIQDGKNLWESKEAYDSVDSYAAVFLVLVSEYLEKGGDNTRLPEWKEGILSVTDTLLGCCNGGLSQVSVKNETRYLMDNVEVNRALRDLEGLLGAVAEQEEAPEEKERIRLLQKEAKETLMGNSSQMEALLWDGASGCYLAGLDGSLEPLHYEDTKALYPIGTAQIYPIVFGFLEEESEKAQSLYEKFCQDYHWEDLSYRKGKKAGSYWGLLSFMGAKMGDFSRVDRYLEESRAALIKEGRDYPYHTAESGWIALACEEMITHIS